ncbi:MAG: hypothetical protein ACR2IH_06615, partial [Pyrinomonadaceae bacterium]
SEAPGVDFKTTFGNLGDKDSSTDDAEFYRKRAVDEVSGLQMVEHMISAIEREHMKIVPKIYDDLTVKRALHNFLRLQEAPLSPEHLEAEGGLLLETEAWCTALAVRDEAISVGNIRRFCENSRPVLSSQALLALARFYRVSPFSEPVRAKFDFVMTKLFTRDTEIEKRRSIFSPAETAGHVKDLYNNWSSLALYDNVSDASSVSGAVETFNAFVAEAEIAFEFDALISSDFFDRTRLFKERCAELCFVPEVTAAAIECNVRIGNRCVDMLMAEKAKIGAVLVEEKYAYNYDTLISTAASKTLGVVKVISQEYEPEVETELKVEPEPAVANRPEKQISPSKQSVQGQSSDGTFFGVNKWLLAATLVFIVISVGIYFWADNYAATQSAGDVAVDVDISDLKADLKLARASSETLYAIVQPNWESMTPDEQNIVLTKTQALAASRGLKQVNLMNAKGRTVGLASASKSEVIKQ